MTAPRDLLIASLLGREQRDDLQADVAEHEAAHAVVALALRGEVLLVHLGHTLGDAPSAVGGAVGVCYSINPLTARGAVAMAGSVWDAHGGDVVGLTGNDASILLEWVEESLGPPPQMLERACQLVADAEQMARQALRKHRAAVLVLAGILARRRSILDTTRLCAAARRASPSLPQPIPPAILAGRAWRCALRHPGDTMAAGILAEHGLVELFVLAQRERATQRARRAR